MVPKGNQFFVCFYKNLLSCACGAGPRVQDPVSAGAVQSAAGSPEPVGGRAGHRLSPAGRRPDARAFPEGRGAATGKAPAGAPRSPAPARQAACRDRPRHLADAAGRYCSGVVSSRPGGSSL